jgi:RHS repeat-associated protein
MGRSASARITIHTGTKSVRRIPATNTSKFTGKERDSETGLDYFGARYFGSNMGRFMSADIGTDQDSAEPQSWNLYSYVRNNPLSNVDPDGNDCVYLNNAGNGVESVDQHSSSGECGNTGGYWVNGAVTNAQINGNSLELTGTTNGVDNNTHASYLTNGDVPLNSYAQGVFSQPVLQTTAATMTDPRAYLLWTGASATLGYSLYAAGVTSGGAGITSILTEDLPGVLSRASSAVGNQGAQVASREVAEQAAKEWVGEGARPITDRITGKVVGEISADGTKVARFTSAESKGYINLVNKITGGNLHVRW